MSQAMSDSFGRVGRRTEFFMHLDPAGAVQPGEISERAAGIYADLH
jgi:hypothetical protein